MASRTKSFFDVDPKKRHGHANGQWKRNASSSNRAALSEAPTNIAPQPQPPIPATAAAKSKLKAFQFVAGDNNHTPPSDTHADTFPCTPGARLPLADLIGDCDATVKEVPVERSPVENIGWIPNSSHELLTPNRRRKRKRAKSSSPPSGAHSSSQPKDAFASFPDRANTRTPAADPAADLWQRYNGKPSGDDAPKLPQISNLAFNASPRPLETPVKGGGLRRWVSTGNDWPSSKHKKRCSNGRASINVWQDQTGVDSAGKSRVASMVQRIQESLATQRIEQEQEQEQEVEHELEHEHEPRPEQDIPMEQDTDRTAMLIAEAPSSSSPLPETVSEILAPPPANASPVPVRHQPMAPPLKKSQTRNSTPQPRGQPSLLRRTDSSGMSAGSMGDPLHPSAAARLHLQSKAPLPAYKRPSITKPQPKPVVPMVVVPPQVNADLDEFGDAFDLDEDDLTELLSQKPLQQKSLYDIPEHPNPPPSKPLLLKEQGAVQQQPITLDDDDDGDEFGDDDLDMDSFAQAEFSATQAFRVSQHQHQS
jgi:DNA replication ATP-dependent helicase Dna2